MNTTLQAPVIIDLQEILTNEVKYLSVVIMMVEHTKQPRLVGSYIRQRREAMGLSQRALGMMFQPPVTTQFISNVERGVTPLPPVHVSTLTKALAVSESELMALLEKEYTAKLSGRLGRLPGLDGDTTVTASQLVISTGDFDFMKNLYDAYRKADPKTRHAFGTICESMLKITKPMGVSES